ncbi:hypothetical protein Ciccas_010402, partial [Cichlidogyrus casuarinus]
MASVESLKFFLILFVCMIIIPYWFVYQQNITMVQPLSSVLNLQISPNFLMPISAMVVFNTIVLLIVSPILSAIATRFPIRYSTRLRNILGYLIFGLATLYLAVLETTRLRDVRLHGCFEQKVALKFYNASTISIFWQTPTHVLTGLSEWFVILNTMEIILKYAPEKIKTLSMGIIHASNATGYLIGTITMKAITTLF